MTSPLDALRRDLDRTDQAIHLLSEIEVRSTARALRDQVLFELTSYRRRLTEALAEAEAPTSTLEALPSSIQPREVAA